MHAKSGCLFRPGKNPLYRGRLRSRNTCFQCLLTREPGRRCRYRGPSAICGENIYKRCSGSVSDTRLALFCCKPQYRERCPCQCHAKRQGASASTKITNYNVNSVDQPDGTPYTPSSCCLWITCGQIDHQELIAGRLVLEIIGQPLSLLDNLRYSVYNRRIMC